MRQRRRLAGSLLGAILLLAGAGCGGDAAAGSEFDVQGYVRDDASHHGLEGARVAFTSDTLFTSSTRSDGDGHYEMRVLTDVPIGRIRAEVAGYDPSEVNVYFDQPSRRVDIELRKIPSATDAGR